MFYDIREFESHRFRQYAKKYAALAAFFLSTHHPTHHPHNGVSQLQRALEPSILGSLFVARAWLLVT